MTTDHLYGGQQQVAMVDHVCQIKKYLFEPGEGVRTDCNIGPVSLFANNFEIQHIRVSRNKELLNSAIPSSRTPPLPDLQADGSPLPDLPHPASFQHHPRHPLFSASLTPVSSQSSSASLSTRPARQRTMPWPVSLSSSSQIWWTSCTYYSGSC